MEERKDCRWTITSRTYLVFLILAEWGKCSFLLDVLDGSGLFQSAIFRFSTAGDRLESASAFAPEVRKGIEGVWGLLRRRR